ncbi:MAG: hypothetical protein HXY34_05600 [Candidatus Thorarchaeota archaeon]|nr:hypothetical protein [Candidatus Thorarchaeota archaeon]
MIDSRTDDAIGGIINEFPQPYRDATMRLWELWKNTDPTPPYYLSWSEFASNHDDAGALYTEQRVYNRRITNELRSLEVPRTLRQRVAHALAAVAGIFLVVFLALSRALRAAE